MALTMGTRSGRRCVGFGGGGLLLLEVRDGIGRGDSSREKEEILVIWKKVGRKRWKRGRAG